MNKSDWAEVKEFMRKFFLWINEHPSFHKFSFHFGNPEHHYTFRIWHDKKEIDIHQTNEALDKSHPEKYKTHFRMSFFALKRIAVELKNIDYNMFLNQLTSSKIKVGKLKRYNCVLIPLDPKDPVFQSFYKEKKGKNTNRIRLNSEFDILNFLTIISPEDGLTHPAGVFMVLRKKKGTWVPNGFVYRFPLKNVHGPRTYMYFTSGLMKNLRDSVGFVFYNIVRKAEFHNKEKIMNLIDEFVPLNWKNRIN